MARTAYHADDLVLCRSDAGDGGWSLHAPGSTDEQIAQGDVPCLVSGEAEWIEASGEWSRPTDADYAEALRVLRVLRARRARQIISRLESAGITCGDDTLGIVVRQALDDDPAATWRDVAEIWAQATADAAADREYEDRS